MGCVRHGSQTSHAAWNHKSPAWRCKLAFCTPLIHSQLKAVPTLHWDGNIDGTFCHAPMQVALDPPPRLYGSARICECGPSLVRADRVGGEYRQARSGAIVVA
jgi:hypothetical protein